MIAGDGIVHGQESVTARPPRALETLPEFTSGGEIQTPYRSRTVW